VEDIAGNVLKLLNTWEKPEEPYMPDPAYDREKLKEYKMQMDSDGISSMNTYAKNSDYPQVGSNGRRGWLKQER